MYKSEKMRPSWEKQKLYTYSVLGGRACDPTDPQTTQPPPFTWGVAPPDTLP